MHGCSLFKFISFRASVKVYERKTLQCIDLCQARLFNRIRSDCWHHLLHIFCHHKVDYILCIYKVYFFTVKVKVKALCSYFCARFKALPDDSECWVHRFIWNKHSCTYTKLSSVLHWQAVMAALAYERQQLEGVSVAVVLTCCGIYFDGCFSVLLSLIRSITHTLPFLQRWLPTVPHERNLHRAYLHYFWTLQICLKVTFLQFCLHKKNRVMLTFRNLPVIQKSVHSSVKLKMLKNLFFHPFFFLTPSSAFTSQKMKNCSVKKLQQITYHRQSCPQQSSLYLREQQGASY